MKAVINSTPLIALSMLNHLFILNVLFDEIFVPSSVYEEVVLKGGNRPGSQDAFVPMGPLRVAPRDDPKLCTSNSEQ